MKLIYTYIFLFFTIISFGQNPDQLILEVNKHLKTLEEDDKFNGAILIAKDGEVIFRDAKGYANLSHKVPNQTDTKFNLASIGKMITAVAIMQLYEQRKLNLNDLVGKHLPNYPNQTIKDSVTIAHLLTHSSGMGQFFNPEYFKSSKDQFRTISDFLPLFVDDQLLFSPGKKYSYSNAGYMVLGLIIEKISGQSYYDFIQQYIYNPLGMKNTGAFDMDAVVENLSIGYVRPAKRSGKWTTNLYKNMKGGPAGGSYSTVNDMLLFANGIQQYKLLSKATTDLMTTGKIMGHANMYGYGFDDRLENNHRIVGHVGGFYGIKCEVMMYWDLGYTVIILTNKNNVGYEDLSLFIQTQLTGTSFEKEQITNTLKVVSTIKKEGFQAVKNNLKNGLTKSLSSDMIEIKGYEQMICNNISTGIDIFKLGVMLEPNSFNAHYNLAAAYKDAEQNKFAIQHFEKCLEIKPDLDFIKKEIENLK